MQPAATALLSLQRTAGNRATARALARRPAAPPASAADLRDGVTTAIQELTTLLATASDMYPDRPLDWTGAAITWDVNHLVRASDALRHAAAAVGAGDTRAAAPHLVAGVLICRVVAMDMAYVKVALEVEKAYPHTWTTRVFNKVGAVRWDFDKWLDDLESGDAGRVAEGVAAVVGDHQTWYDFSQFVDDMQERMEAHHRFLQWLDIAQLAWMLLEVWTLPAGGGAGSPAPPTLEGMPAMAGGHAMPGLASADALAAIRHLVDIGAIAEPALVHALGGRTGALAAPPAAAAATPTAGLNEAARAEAEKLVAAATAAEPSITPTLVKTADAVGGRMVGLQERVKSVDSLTRKLADWAAGRLPQAKTAAAAVETVSPKMNDVLRYTMELPTEGYTAGVRETVRRLDGEGWTWVKGANAWDPNLKPFLGSYRGINATFRTAEGQVLELQFHTEESFAVKMETHAWYEEQRLPETPAARKGELMDMQREAYRNVPTPAGALEIEMPGRAVPAPRLPTLPPPRPPER